MINLYEKYRHRKRGSEYTISGIGKIQIATDIKDGDEVVIYRNTDTFKICVRKTTEFEDGRFERID
jgi:hypothetical protein